MVALSYMRLSEYHRAAHITTPCISPPVRFIHYYSRYLAAESSTYSVTTHPSFTQGKVPLFLDDILSEKSTVLALRDRCYKQVIA